MKRTRNVIIWCWMFALASSGSFMLNPQPVAAQQKTSQKTKPAPAARIDNPEEPDTFQSEMRPYIDRFITDRNNLNRFYTAELSPNRQAKMHEFLNKWVADVAKLDFEGMNEESQIDYILFKNYIDHEVRQLDLDEKGLAETAVFHPFAKTITDLEDSRRKMEPTDFAKDAATLNDINKQIAKLRLDIDSDLRAGRTRWRFGKI